MSLQAQLPESLNLQEFRLGKAICFSNNGGSMSLQTWPGL